MELRSGIWFLSASQEISILLAQLGFQCRYHPSRPTFPKLSVHTNHLEILLKYRHNLLGLMEPAFCISNKLPGDSEVADLETTL